MKLAVLAAIHTLHPEQDWLHIHKDGSLTNKHVNVTAGIYCTLFSSYLTLGQHTIHFDEDLEAINLESMPCFSTKGSFKKTVIFTDPPAAVQSLEKVNDLLKS